MMYVHKDDVFFHYLWQLGSHAYGTRTRETLIRTEIALASRTSREDVIGDTNMMASKTEHGMRGELYFISRAVLR